MKYATPLLVAAAFLALPGALSANSITDSTCYRAPDFAICSPQYDDDGMQIEVFTEADYKDEKEQMDKYSDPAYVLLKYKLPVVHYPELQSALLAERVVSYSDTQTFYPITLGGTAYLRSSFFNDDAEDVFITFVDDYMVQITIHDLLNKDEVYALIETITYEDLQPDEAESGVLPPAESDIFPDVPATHINAQAIAYVRDNNIVSGYPDGTYQPENAINRAEFTKIIVNAALGEVATGAAASCFPDIAADAWFASFVCTAKTEGIIAGYPDGRFKPAANINAAEAFKIVVEAFDIPFDDGSAAGQWYQPYWDALLVRSAIPASVTTPGQLLTRGEMAAIIWSVRVNVSASSSSSSARSSSSASSVTTHAMQTIELPVANNLLAGWDLTEIPFSNWRGTQTGDITYMTNEIEPYLRVNFAEGAGCTYMADDPEGLPGGVFALATGGVDPAESMTIQYEMRLPPDFPVQISGHLPGIFGGTVGNTVDSHGIFVHPMWDRDGKLFLTGIETKDQVNRTPIAYDLPTDGKWHTYSLHVEVNTTGALRRGSLITVDIDRERVMTIDDVFVRVDDSDLLEGFYFTSCFGRYGVFTPIPAATHLDIRGMVISRKRT